MIFTKKKIAAADAGYSLTTASLLGKQCIIAASEANEPAFVCTEPDFKPQVLAAEPGGCMGFAAIPGRDDALLMITEFYPVFKSEHAGIHLYTAKNGFAEPWEGKRVIDLPYVHRIASVGGFLIASTVCSGKDYQEDWSQPGTVYVAAIPEDLEGGWQLKPVMEGIHRNHGMSVGTYKNRETIFITGTEGVFALFVPDSPQDVWSHEQILAQEVSEIALHDFDGDGEEEMAVIEPFHGNTLSVYKSIQNNWKQVFSASLHFGHGLWAGDLGGSPAIVVGNRRESKDLVCYAGTGFDLKKQIVDPASGTTNLIVLNNGDKQFIVSANQEYREYAIYTVENE